MPIFPPVQLSANSQYMVGWEQMNGISGKNFLAGRDLSMESEAPLVTNFVYINDASPSWGWITQVAGIRMHGVQTTGGGHGCRIVGLEEVSSDKGLFFTLSPNPSTNQFAIEIRTSSKAKYQLKIRNTLGQIIHEEQIAVDGNFSKSIHLEEAKAGLYFVSIENGQERKVEKLIIK